MIFQDRGLAVISSLTTEENNDKPYIFYIYYYYLLWNSMEDINDFCLLINCGVEADTYVILISKI